MLPLKLTFSLFAFLSLIVEAVAGVQLIYGGDVDGALGDKRYFNGHTVKWTGTVYNVNDNSRCCEKCWRDYPDTQMYNSIGWGTCSCQKTKPGKRPATIGSSSAFAGVCGDVSGGVGSDRYFIKKSVRKMGTVYNVAHQNSNNADPEDRRRCCEECTKIYPDTDMIDYFNNVYKSFGGYNYCRCYKTITRTQPRTEHYYGYVAGLCGDGEMEGGNSTKNN